MNEDVIDYEALCKRLIVENERLKTAKVSHAARSLHVDLAKLRDFLEDNYLVLMLLLFVASSLIAGIYTVYQDRRQGA